MKKEISNTFLWPLVLLFEKKIFTASIYRSLYISYIHVHVYIYILGSSSLHLLWFFWFYINVGSYLTIHQLIFHQVPWDAWCSEEKVPSSEPASIPPKSDFPQKQESGVWTSATAWGLHPPCCGAVYETSRLRASPVSEPNHHQTSHHQLWSVFPQRAFWDNTEYDILELCCNSQFINVQ